jgi:hypothetical protein
MKTRFARSLDVAHAPNSVRKCKSLFRDRFQHKRATTSNKTPELLLVVAACYLSLPFLAYQARKERKQRREIPAMSSNNFSLES